MHNFTRWRTSHRLAGLLSRTTGRGYLDTAGTGAAFGAPLWAVVSVTLLPLLSGHAPAWTPEGMRAAFPALVAWVAAGVGVGIVLQALADLANSRSGPECAEGSSAPLPVRQRIVILGGGFAGLATAQHLEQAFGPDPSVSITLVSETVHANAGRGRGQQPRANAHQQPTSQRASQD